MPPRSTAIYARVSSEQQTNETTIASQIAALEARVAQDDLALAPDNRFVDEGYSGATLVRPALERLRDAVAAGGLDRLYVHSPDRLARRYAYQVLLMDEFRRAGVEVVFLNRAIGLSPEDDLLLQVQGMVAEYERAKILERSRRGKRHAARQGAVSVLSGAPYGYRYIGKREGGGVARYEIMADEARIVRLIFEWIGCERVSIGEVCRRLRQQGCPTRSGKSTWDRTTVWGLLKNPAYAGTAAFGKTRIGPMPTRLRAVRGGSDQPRRASGVYAAAPSEWMGVPVPALVEGALFEAAQEQLAENRHRSRQQARGERYLLQGLAVCRQCGYAYYGKPVSLRSANGKRRTYAYYRCCGSDAYRFGGQRVCSNAQVRTDQLDAAVWREVERLLQDPSWIAAEYERRLAREGAPGAGDLAGIEAQIAKLRRGMGRLIDSYAEGLIDKAEFEPRITGLRKRIQGWEEQAVVLRDAAEQRAALSLIVGRLEDFARQVCERVASVDWHLQRDLIRTLVKRVEIDREDVNVVLRVTPSPIGPGSHGPRGERVLHHRGRSSDTPLRGTLRPLHEGSVRRLDGCTQPPPNIQLHPGEVRVVGHGPFDQVMRDGIKAGLDVQIDDPIGAPAALPRRPDRIQRRPAGTIGIGQGGSAVPPRAPGPSSRPSAPRGRPRAECRGGVCRRCPSVSRRAARGADGTSPTPSGSRPCKDCPSGPSRTPPETPHPRPRRHGSLSPAGTLSRRVALECQKASPPTPAHPIAGWLVSSAGVSGPFAPPALPGFITTTNPSVPWPRIGTRLLVGLPLGGLPWHRGDRFPRSAQEPLAGLTPSLCRSPLGQSAGIRRASSQANDWSLVLATSLRFRHVSNGSLAFV